MNNVHILLLHDYLLKNYLLKNANLNATNAFIVDTSLVTLLPHFRGPATQWNNTARRKGKSEITSTVTYGQWHLHGVIPSDL